MTTATAPKTTSTSVRKASTNVRAADIGVHRIEVLGTDPGNRFIKHAIAPEEPAIMPSVYYALDDDQETSPDDPQSVTIAYKAGPYSEMQGKRYVVGAQAAELRGTPTMEGEKIDSAPSLILAAIAKVATERATRVDKVLVALPDDRDKESSEAIQDKIVGTHTIEIDGNLQTVQVCGLEARTEGFDAFRWASKCDQLPPGKINGVIDVGGGNTSASLFSARGTLMRESRLVMTGALAIARKISQHSSMLKVETKGNTARLDLILNGIADGSLTYGNTRRNFSETYERYRQQWELSIRSKIKTSWQDWVSEIGRIAIVGGGAEMLRPVEVLTKGVFFVASDPQTATVRGMVL